jgi:hypothetical protein
MLFILPFFLCLAQIYLTPLREALLSGAEILSAEEMEVGSLRYSCSALSWINACAHICLLWTRAHTKTLFSRDITTMFTLHATLLIELKTTAAFTSALSSFVPYLKVLQHRQAWNTAGFVMCSHVLPSIQKIYTQYVNNFPRAMELLTQRSARSRRFVEFIKVRPPPQYTHENVHGIDAGPDMGPDACRNAKRSPIASGRMFTPSWARPTKLSHHLLSWFVLFPLTSTRAAVNAPHAADSICSPAHSTLASL